MFGYRVSTYISVVCGRIFVTHFFITKIGNMIIEFLPHINIFIEICMSMYWNKLSRTSTSSESVIRLTSNLSFLNQGRPTICLSRLSVRSVWNQNLINFSVCPAWIEGMRREEKRRVDEQQESKFGPYNQYILHVLYNEINFIQVFQKIEDHSVSSFYISKCTISDLKTVKNP